MKTTLIAVTAFIASIAFGSGTTYAQSKMEPGASLPVVKQALHNASGNGADITLEKAAGKNGLLVMFSCNTCPFVVKNQSVTRQTINEAFTHDVGVIVINSNEAKRGDDDSYAAMKQYANRQQYSVPYVVDDNSAIADLFGANHTPEVFLFDSHNKLVYKGAMNDNPGDPNSYKTMYVTEAINAMIAGKKPNPQTTKSIGCSIKRKA